MSSLCASEKRFEDDDDEAPTTDVKSRDWNFTWNNYPQNFEELLLERLGPSSIKYIIMGREVCPTTGTPHIQGFVMFHNPRAVGKNMKKSGKPHARSLRGLFPTISWHKVYDTPHKAAAYCRKTDANAIEYGERPTGQGERTDLHAVAAELRAGARPEDLAVSHTAEYIKYGRGIQMAYHDLHLHRDDRPFVVWFYGRTGLGKNKIVEAKHGTDYYLKADGTPFWIGYDYQQAVILDEFTTVEKSKKGWDFETFLQILTSQRTEVHVKGGHARFSSPFIYVTSPHPPDHFYPDWDSLSQVLRRLDGVYKILETDKCEFQDQWKDYYYSADKVVKPTFTHCTLENIWKNVPLRSAMRAAIVPRPAPVPGKDLALGMQLPSQTSESMSRASTGRFSDEL